MSAPAADLRALERKLRRAPRTVVQRAGRDIGKYARERARADRYRRISGLGGRLTVKVRTAQVAGAAAARIQPRPGGAWGFATYGAVKHDVGREGQRLRRGDDWQTGPVEIRRIAGRGTWLEVIRAAEGIAVAAAAAVVDEIVR